MANSFVISITGRLLYFASATAEVSCRENLAALAEQVETEMPNPELSRSEFREGIRLVINRFLENHGLALMSSRQPVRPRGGVLAEYHIRPGNVYDEARTPPSDTFEALDRASDRSWSLSVSITVRRRRDTSKAYVEYAYRGRPPGEEEMR